jgi:hypothetical protein
MSEGMMKMLRWMLMLAVIGTAVCGLGQQPVGKDKDTGVPAAPASQEQDERSFLVSFYARELDQNGKEVNLRRFDTMTGVGNINGRSNSIRTGAKIPILTGGKPGEAQGFTYVDVGVNIDVNRVRVVDGNRLAMQVSAEISSVDQAASASTNQPTIRSNRWMGEVQVPIGERKVIFRSDDLASKKTMQIEVAVTRVY